MTTPTESLHPIVEAMSPNAEQRAILACGAGDVVVTAGAGTGKTRTLVARYLAHLAEGLDLRAIVAVTFTRKAANEMRNRVREAIRAYALGPEDGHPDRALWRGHYSALDSARIGTIHSLCSEILRSQPLEAGVDPRFRVLDEGRMGILLGEAAEAALAEAASREEMTPLFAHLGERSLGEVLDALLWRPLEAAEALASVAGDPRPLWREALACWQAERLAALRARGDWRASHARLAEARPLTHDDRLVTQWEAVVAALADSPADCVAAVAAYAPIGAINLQGGSAKAWPRGKEELAEIKAALKDLREAWKSEQPLLAHSLGPRDDLLADLLPRLAALFAAARGAYARLKDEAQSLDYDDLERLTVALLREHPEVCARWRHDVGALLVDEFQDTNARQSEIVALLDGDRRRRFVVGDAKQSIYRFRGADVTVFRRVQEEVGRERVYPLDTSYRAHAGLVAALNDTLRPILGEDEDPSRPWAAPFAPLAAHRREPAAGFAPPHIEAHLVAGTKAEGALDCAAGALAARIREMVEGGAHCVGDGERARPLGYGDVAILCRASTSFAAYEDALERAGVPFTTVAGRGFYDRPEVRDVLNALAALADPSDDLALVGLLRSPAVGLSDEAILRLREAARVDEPPAALCDVLPRASAVLGGLADDRLKALRAAALVADLHALAGRATVARLLKRFLDRTAYRAALVAVGQTRAARNLDKLLGDARESGIVGVGEFLEYVGALRDSGVREGEARALTEGAVQIMSVHMAKGLEFPVVAIGDVGHASRPRSGLLLDPVLGPLLPLAGEDKDDVPAAYRLGRWRDEDQDAAESDRLLYVAATRAMERLLVSGCLTLSDAGQVRRAGGWLGRLLAVWGLEGQSLPCGPQGAAAHALRCGVGESEVEVILYEARWEPLPGGTRGAGSLPAADRAAEDVAIALPPALLTLPPPPGQALDEGAEDAERRPPRRVWEVVPRAGDDRAPAWVLGQLVHEALAAWRVGDPGRADSAREDPALAAWAEARALDYGVGDATQRARLGADAARLLEGFRASGLYAAMDGAERRLHEVPYSRYAGRVFERGVLDALYLHDGVWTIVEFKTDAVQSDKDLDELLRETHYLRQTDRYVEAAHAALRVRPEAILCLLNYDGHTKWYPLEALRARLA